jgi:hemophore-related protein
MTTLKERAMLFTPRAAHCAAAGAVAIGAIVGTMLFGAVPSALADPPPPPPPGCSAGDLEHIRAGVSEATAAYLFTHPDVNAFFSSMKGQPKDQVRDQVKTYFAANPQTQSELAAIRQPLRDLRSRCQ